MCGEARRENIVSQVLISEAPSYLVFIYQYNT